MGKKRKITEEENGGEPKRLKLAPTQDEGTWGHEQEDTC